MLFNILDVYKDTKVQVLNEVNKDKLDFPIEFLINRRRRDSYNPNMFSLLNRYLDYKDPSGKNIKQELFKAYEESYNDILGSMEQQDLYPLPYEIVSRIIDKLDFNDIRNFIVKHNLVTAPNNLADAFDMNIEKNKEGSRVQTYLKEDYIDLVTLITLLKSIIPVIGFYATANVQKIPTDYRDLILINFLLKHPISELEPFVKLQGYIKKLISNIESNDEELNIRLIKNGIDIESLGYKTLGGVLFENLLLSDLLGDDEDKNIVTKLYRYASSKLDIKNSNTSSIKLKEKYKTSLDNGGEDTESTMESYRIPTDLTPGFIEEFNWTVSDPELMLKWLTKEKELSKEDLDLLKSFELAVNSIPARSLVGTVIKLGFIVTKDIIDPRSYLYIEAAGIRNILTVAGAFLWKRNFKFMALLMASGKISNDTFVVSYNSKLKIDKDTKEIIDTYFPIRMYNKNPKTKMVTKNENISENIINTLTDDLLKVTFKCYLDSKLIEEVTESSVSNLTIPQDMKHRLLEMLISLEESL